ncbi:MAG: hypothetical protein Q8M76_18895 [Spirochaetaceae bacterium]|nr:hypothetical protein [Spirochaetaceae bacterium]
MRPSPLATKAPLGSRLGAACLIAAFFAGCSTLRPAYAANRDCSLVSIRFLDAPEGEPPLFDGAAVKGVALAKNPITESLDIELVLFEEPAELFFAITVANIGRSLELRLCGEFSSTATIQSPISNGSFRIQGSWSEDQANEIAARIAGTR